MQNTQNFYLSSSPETIAAATGCTRATAKRWHNMGAAMPPMAQRLLKFYVNFDLSAAFGNAWQGFHIRDGLLCGDIWLNGISPMQLRKAFLMARQVSPLESELNAPNRDLEALRRRCAVLERDNRFYREQVRMEAALHRCTAGAFNSSKYL